MINLAILSPNKDAISETFIKAHRKLPFNITYLYGGTVPFKKETQEDEFRIRLAFLKGLNFFIKSLNPHIILLKSQLKKNKIDVVLAEYGLTAADSLEAIKETKCKLIVHFHGYDASRFDILAQYNNKYKQVFNYATHVIVVSQKMKQTLIEIGCSPDKIILNIYGPNDDFKHLKPTLHSKKFISVGRFVDKKAPYLTILAFHEVIKKYSDAELTFIGSGPLLNACKNICFYLNIEKNITFLGAQNKETVIKEFEKSIGFVQHSITAEDGDSEGAPVAILEAQLAGLPVISTLHAGIPEIVIHNKTGYLVPEKDVSSMAEYMIKILEDKENTIDMSKNAREHIINNFSMKKHLETLSKLIKDEGIHYNSDL